MGLCMQKVECLEESIELLLDPVNVELLLGVRHLLGQTGSEDIKYETQEEPVPSSNMEMVQQSGDVFDAGVVRTQSADVQHDV